jgi:hypothetical protein
VISSVIPCRWSNKTDSDQDSRLSILFIRGDSPIGVSPDAFNAMLLPKGS